MLRHFVLHASSKFRDIACWVAELSATLCLNTTLGLINKKYTIVTWLCNYVYFIHSMILYTTFTLENDRNKVVKTGRNALLFCFANLVILHFSLNPSKFQYPKCSNMGWTEAVMVQGHERVTVNATIISLIPIWGNEIFIIFMFLSSRSGNKAKHGVEYRHSTRNSTQL